MNAGTVTPAARLCAECGMCCDGVLFHSVVLQPGDFPRKLASLGFKLRRKRGAEYFLQPCSAYQGCRCSLYDDRPIRCRDFRCSQLVRLASGEIDEAVALENIRKARALVARVDAAIAQLAQTNPHRSLAQRCANALTTDDPTPAHKALKSAMEELAKMLETHFRVE